jgi:ribosome maturation factor RimP
MDELRNKIEKLMPTGFYLMNIKEDPHKGLVRCLIDSEDSISLDDTAMISKLIQHSGVLDQFYPDGASLEVTSLGVTEPLTHSFQYRKNIGRKLNITYDKNGYRKNVEAELTGFDGEILFLQNKNKGHFQLELANILQAKVIIQFK